jgi:adenylate kinase family enzyme
VKRVLVTGNAGSGKSTISKQLADSMGVPHFSLDGIVWKEGWKKTPTEERQKRMSELLAQDTWVIDGVSHQIYPAADVIIFLDIPRRICFWQAAKRNRKYLFRSRPELPANCPEILIIPQLIKIIWRFPNRVRPKILAEKSRREGDGTFIHVRKYQDLEHLL